MNVNVRRIASHLKREFVCHLSATRHRKILFDHLPKCGGSTLNAYLEAHYPKRRIFSIDGSNPAEVVGQFKGLPKRKRHAYSLIKGHLANELFDYVDPACLKITVLRDPVERIISHYFFAKKNRNHYLYSSIHNSEMNLEDYASSNLSGELRNWYTTHFSGLPLDVVEGKPEESIAKASEVLLKRYNIVGFLDSFPLFIENLRKQAKLGYEYNNNRVNVTQNRPIIQSIPKSTIEKIEQINYLDIALYRRVREAIG